MSGIRRTLCALLATSAIGLAGAATAHADQITLTGATDTRECVITNQSYNGCTSFFVGTYGELEAHALMWFDIAGNLPANAVIETAFLRLYEAGDPQNAVESTLVYKSETPWTEDATWETSDGTTPWTTAGGDWGTYPRSVDTIDGHWVEFDIWQYVQEWLYDGGALNFGAIVTNPYGALGFQDETGDHPYELVIDYHTE